MHVEIFFYKTCISNRKIIKRCKNAIERANCMLLFEKIEIKPHAATQFSIKMNTQKNECMIC